MTTQTEDITFDSLVKIEPRLYLLLKEAQQYRIEHYERSPNGYLDTWYKVIKPKLVKLVGYSAEGPEPELHTSRAYDICYQFLFYALTSKRLVRI